MLARDAVCLLDVPAHKTGTAFTKPVDPVLGQALDAWQAVRPAQPKFTDRRTGELVDLLFAFRGPEGLHHLHQQHGHPGALPQGRRPRRRRPREHHQPPGPIHDRQPALQREGANDPVRAASLARPPVAAVHPVLRASTEAKRKALEAASTDIVTDDLPEWNHDPALLTWLASL